MKAKVDAEACVGCGLCAETCAAVFEMEDNVAKVVVDTVPDDVADACREAARDCPVEAIEVEE
jgi:ferredoxin